MNIFRSTLMVLVYVFLAGYFLMLLAERSLQVPRILAISDAYSGQCESAQVKPSPIEMLRQME